MKIQNFSNYKRYYYPHHFIFYPVCLILILISADKLLDNTEPNYMYLLLIAAFFVIAWLSFMLRQHYAMTCQNRIIRLEMRLRYYQLTQQRLEQMEEKLSFDQLAALRFASDDELPALVDRTITEKLSPIDIKRSISNWQPDHMRI